MQEYDQEIIAVISGKPLTVLPPNLFIPPDALKVLLDSFTGPLDLLLYLIRRQNIDIMDIPIVQITEQYLHYIQLMEDNRLELAADYLVMAAMLAEIKSRLLLPINNLDNEEAEEDPRLLLVQKLQLYEQFKQAAIELDQLPRCEREVFRFTLTVPDTQLTIIHPDVSLLTLTTVMQELMTEQEHLAHHQISREPLSVKDRILLILDRLQQEKSITFNNLLKKEEGRIGLVVSFLAVLELARQSLLSISQTAAFTPIYLEVK